MIETLETKKTKAWEPKLLQFIKARAEIPFAWGKNDCVTFAADAIEVMTGEDPIAWGRGRYSNQEEAMAVLKGHFGVGLFKTFNRIFEEMGFTQTDSVHCGDIAFVRVENMNSGAARLFDYLTLVVGINHSGVIIGPGKDGLSLTNNYELVKAWKL